MTHTLFLFLSLLWLPSGGGSFFLSASTVPRDARDSLDAYLTGIERFGFSGAVLVALDGEVILNKGYGWADRSARLPNTAETIFSTGSLTKQFTAAAILKLETHGRLRTEDPIGTYLGDVPADKQAVTIHHLLTHTAGLPPFGNVSIPPPSREEMKAQILSEPLDFEPGTAMQYSNAGYTLLAMIIEAASGQAYPSYLEAHLFDPLGMADTGYRRPGWDAGRVAHWYVGDQHNGSPFERPMPNWSIYGSGGILTTTNDMHRWMQALDGEDLLPAEAKTKYFTPFLNDYAYGWGVLDTPHGRLIEHDGGNTLGVGAYVHWFSEAGVVAIGFCNDGGETMLLRSTRENIRRLLFGEDVPLPPAAVSVDAAVRAKYAGTYTLPSGAHLLFEATEEGLQATGEGQDALHLLATGRPGTPTRHENLNARGETVMAGFVRGDFQPLRDALAPGWDLPAGAIEAELGDTWQAWTTQHGPFQAVTLLGTVAQGEEDFLTYFRLNFERGAAYYQLYWGPRGLAGFRATEAPWQRLLIPQSDSTFAGYDVPTAQVLPVTFHTTAGGAVTGLTIDTRNGAVFARAGTVPPEASELPPTEPAGATGSLFKQRINDLIALINRDDTDASRRFIETRFAPDLLEQNSVDRLLDIFEQVHDRHGALSVVGLDINEDGTAQAEIESERPGPILRFDFSFEPDEPYRINRFGIEAGN